MVFHIIVKDDVTYLDKNLTVPNVVAIIDLVFVVVLSIFGSFSVGHSHKKKIAWKYAHGYCLCYCKTLLLVPDLTACTNECRVQYIIRIT